MTLLTQEHTGRLRDENEMEVRKLSSPQCQVFTSWSSFIGSVHKVIQHCRTASNVVKSINLVIGPRVTCCANTLA